MCRWMYNRALDKVLTVGRAATQGSATYNQLAQYVVSDSMFSTLICYLSFRLLLVLLQYLLYEPLWPC